MGYTGARQPGALQSMQPSSNNVHTMPESSVYPRRSEPSAESYFQFGSLNPMPPTTNYYPGSYSTYSNPVPQENRSYPTTYPRFGVPVPRNNLAQYGTYMHDFLGTHRATYSYGTPGYENYAQDTRSAYQPPYVAQHRALNLMPQRSYPANGHGQHHGFAPYRPRPPR